MPFIREIHTAPADEGGRGWSDAGYHGLFCFDRTFEMGRPWSRVPAAQGGHNTGTLAFALQGLNPQDFTQPQQELVIEACEALDRAKMAAGERMPFHGHNEVSAKACPVFDYRRVLGLDANGIMRFSPDPTARMPDPGDTDEGLSPAWAILEMWDRGPNVRALQEALNDRHGAGLVVDGIFGQNTRRAVVAAQRAAGVAADGIVGPQTRRALDL